MGLHDYKARIYIELNRDPQTIEEALQEVMTYFEIMKNPSEGDDTKKTVRQVKTNDDNKNWGKLNGKTPDDRSKGGQNNSESTDQKPKTMTITENELKTLFDQMYDSKQSKLKSETVTNQNKTMLQTGTQNSGYRTSLVCFSCGQPGHIARNCLGKAKRNYDTRAMTFGSSWDQNRNEFSQRGTLNGTHSTGVPQTRNRLN